jgi:hypothetical protein
MQHDRAYDTTLYTVRTAVARQLRVPINSVQPRHVLEADLKIDVLDLALVCIQLEDMTGVEIVVPSLPPDATVEDFATAVAPILERYRDDRHGLERYGLRRTGTGGRP